MLHGTSQMEGFHKLTRKERLARLKRYCALTDTQVDLLSGDHPLGPEIAENLIENSIGYFPIPLGVATYFKIDGRELFIPMAVEETSIVAAASATAKWVQKQGVIRTYSNGRLIIGQIQIPFPTDAKRVAELLHGNRANLIEFANQLLPGLINRGGGITDLQVREIPRSDTQESMLVIHLMCDPCDAMGANLINQVCEALKPRIEELTGERVGLCILSNLVDSKLAVAEVVIRDIDADLGHGIEEATLFAKADPYRAATHNKGVLNGIDPILIATGNDWRAVEAGVHAYAARSGRYQPITDWWMEGRDLFGRIEIPLAVGTVGGVTRLHPHADVALKILGVSRAEDLARICAAVGLVQNLGALKALSTVGIVKGHMQLHATNLALAAGAEKHEMAEVCSRLVDKLKDKKAISLTYAKEVLDQLRAAASQLLYPKTRELEP